ncbi:MAG: nucleotidyltransferase family protein [Alphaproteobacteria bacterium]
MIRPRSPTPEFRLLCLGSRRRTPEVETALRLVATEIGDWKRVIRGAEIHHVVPLLARPFETPGGDAFPAEVRELLTASHRQQARRCLAQVAEGMRLTQVLADGGIRAMVLKGVPLSQQIYGDPSLRGLGDIDLLVDPARFSEARERIAALGYRPADVRGGDVHAVGDTNTLIRELVFRHPDGVLLELKRRLTQDPAAPPIDFESLWRDRRRVEEWGRPVWTPSAEHNALYLVVHGALHGWSRLRWIVDVEEVFADPDFRQRVLSLARTMELYPAVAEAIALSGFLMGDGEGVPRCYTDEPINRLIVWSLAGCPRPWAWPRPQWPLDTGAQGGRCVKYCARRYYRWFLAGDVWAWAPSPAGAAWHDLRELRLRWCRYTLRRNWRGAWSQFKMDLADPVDWSIFRLSPSWRWLYPFLRPLGWVLRRLRR